MEVVYEVERGANRCRGGGDTLGNQETQQHTEHTDNHHKNVHVSQKNDNQKRRPFTQPPVYANPVIPFFKPFFPRGEDSGSF